MKKTMKQLGQVKHCKFTLTDGFMGKNTMDMEYNKLVLLCGMNGTGKSVILKMTWAFALIMNSIIVANKMKLPLDKKEYKYILDSTFTDFDLTGDIHYEYDCGSTILIKFDKGNITDCIPTYNISIEPQSPPIFMSTNTRLLNNTIIYLKHKALLGIVDSKMTEIELNKLLSIYRLYDIMFMEGLLHRIPKMKPMDYHDLNVDLLKFDPDFDPITFMLVDDVKNDILYTTAKVKDVSVSRFGNGHQSLITMMLGTKIYM